MKSPFPGMDPFLEPKWPEVHASLIVYARNQLNSLLPTDLQANIEENLEVRYNSREGYSIRPDLHVGESKVSVVPEGLKSERAESLALAEPMLRVRRHPHPDRHLEIRGQNGTVVTAIEFISPWNKLGARNREQYSRKQLDYMDAGVNLVEIDLVRQGSYVLAVPIEDIPEDKRKGYMICVYRDVERISFDIYFASMRERLPNIAIPLRSEDRDVVLQLQPLLDACYRDGRYYLLDYSINMPPKFSEEDTHWMNDVLKQCGRK